MKLSPRLIEILRLMNSGWELGLDIHSDGSYHWRLQQGGLGWGGDCIYPDGRTKIKTKLIKEGFITDNGEYHYPTTPYFLTDKGKQFLKELK